MRYKIRRGFIIPGNERLLKGEVKPPGCIYPSMHRCKGCELNEVPDLSDGGCMLKNPYYNVQSYE